MEYIKHNLKSILIVFVIFGGLIVSLILIKNPTIFKSKAAADIDYPSALNITDEQNQQLNYKGEGVYIIKDNKIKIGVKDFDKLIQNKQLNTTEVIKYYEALPAEWSDRNNSVIREEFTAKNIEPLSTIPPSCNSIGPSTSIKIPTVAPWLKSDTGFIESIRKFRESGTICVVPTISSLVWLWGCGGTGGSLWYKWDDSGNIPLTQGDEDPRWMIKALRMIVALQGNQSNYWTDVIKYWNKIDIDVWKRKALSQALFQT